METKLTKCVYGIHLHMQYNVTVIMLLHGHVVSVPNNILFVTWVCLLSVYVYTSMLSSYGRWGLDVPLRSVHIPGASGVLLGL
jgi:hypothetical protein